MNELNAAPHILNHKDFLLVGNGNTPIEDSALDSLAGKIHQNTAIILSTHGSILKWSHRTHLFSKPIYTANLLNKLQHINPNINHKIFLDSCYSGYAAIDANMMSIGSVLVTYSDGIIYENIFRNLKKFISTILHEENKDPIAKYIETLHEHLYDKVTFSFVEQSNLYNSYIRFKLGLSPIGRVKIVKLSPKIQELNTKGKLVFNEAFESFFEFVGSDYKSYSEKVLKAVDEVFLNFLSKQLMHCSLVGRIDNFGAILSYCRKFSDECNLQQVINIKDEFFNQSLLELTSIKELNVYNSLLSPIQEISFKPHLVSEFHEICEVLE